jgi:hypothetical protein
MSRTYRHTKPEYVYRTDEDGFIWSEDWVEASKHYDQYGGWRNVEKRSRNRRLRYDRKFEIDFDDYTMPNDRLGWWD